MIATQQDAAIVAAMARLAAEDRELIQGANLSDAQARAWFATEERGMN